MAVIQSFSWRSSIEKGGGSGIEVLLQGVMIGVALGIGLFGEAIGGGGNNRAGYWVWLIYRMW